jgi:hypothetical protein
MCTCDGCWNQIKWTDDMGIEVTMRFVHTRLAFRSHKWPNTSRVGLVADETKVSGKECVCWAVDLSVDCFSSDMFSVKCMLQQTVRDGYGEYDLVARDEVQSRLFANHNLAPDSIVAMERPNLRELKSCDLEIWFNRICHVDIKLFEKKGCNGIRIG